MTCMGMGKGSTLQMANDCLFTNPLAFFSGEGYGATFIPFSMAYAMMCSSSVSLEALIARFLPIGGTVKEATFR